MRPVTIAGSFGGVDPSGLEVFVKQGGQTS